jgi:hypothetical protein
MLQHSCGKLHCQNYFNFLLFLYKSFQEDFSQSLQEALLSRNSGTKDQNHRFKWVVKSCEGVSIRSCTRPRHVYAFAFSGAHASVHCTPRHFAVDGGGGRTPCTLTVHPQPSFLEVFGRGGAEENRDGCDRVARVGTGWERER